MAITQTMTDTCKEDLLTGDVHFDTDTFKIALFTSDATLDASTTAYVDSNQVTSDNYTAGGVELTGATVSVSDNIAFVDFADATWSNVTFTARGALIYNTSNSNASIAVLDFGSDKTVTNGTFTVTFPRCERDHSTYKDRIMADSFTTKLKFVKPEVGGSSGGWGTTINSQLIDMLEEAIAGVGDVSSWSSNNADISSISNGTTSTGRAMILTLSAGSGGTAIGGAGRLTVPGTSKVYIVINNTAYAVTVGSGGSGGVAVPAGKTMLLVHNGTQIVDGLNEVAGNLAIGGTLTVDGATTMASTLGVTGDVAVNTNKFTIAGSDGDTSIAGTLGVGGAITGD